MSRHSCFLLICGLTLLGGHSNSTTGLDLRALHAFPLTRVHSGGFTVRSEVHFDGIAAAVVRGKDNWNYVEIVGRDKLGKPWDIDIADIDEIWRGDLDGNGTNDYVLRSTGPYLNGRTTPNYSLSFLLMDRDGRPFPYFVPVYRYDDAMRQIVDIDQDGRAEVIVSSYDEAPSDPYAEVFCSGHWVHQLYRFETLTAVAFRGRKDGIEFPLIHNWNDRTCGTANAKPRRVAKASVRDESTSAQNEAHGTFIGTRDGAAMSVVGVKRCGAVAATMIIYERPEGRVIQFPNIMARYQERWLATVKRGTKVRFRGLSAGDTDLCFANLAMIASE